MQTFDLDTVQQRLAKTSFIERGDHDLNPGFRPGGKLRPAAVLVGLVDEHEGLSVLFTKRTDHLEHHPGQISFPGGHVEQADHDEVAAALRETHEETGIAPESIDVLGRLDTYVTRMADTDQLPLNLEPDVSLERQSRMIKVHWISRNDARTLRSGTGRIITTYSTRMPQVLARDGRAVVVFEDGKFNVEGLNLASFDEALAAQKREADRVRLQQPDTP